MSPNFVHPCSEELYARLVAIISPKLSSPPVVQEIAILPSYSHPTIQSDPSCNPPAIGIPKTLLLSCFLRARNIFFSHLAVRRGIPVVEWDPNVPIDKEWMAACEATAVILLWDPNHLTAINWRKKAFAKDSARVAELAFLESLQTSPMPQHAKSSTLWAYRLQILREVHSITIAWREELRIVMVAGERHSKNYHAWEHARQVWRLYCDDRRRIESVRDKDNIEEEVGAFQEIIRLVHKWCTMHPRDISGWTFLAFLLRSPPHEAMQLKEATKTIELTKRFVANLNWQGTSVGWFLSTFEEPKLLDKPK